MHCSVLFMKSKRRRRVVFDSEPVVLSTPFCANVFLQGKRNFIVSAVLRHESHFPGAF